MTALAAGTPQLAIHAGSDQEVIAERLAGVRAAQSLPNAHADPEAIRTAVRRLLDDPVHRDTATRLRREMTDLPTPAERVDTLPPSRADVRAGSQDPTVPPAEPAPTARPARPGPGPARAGAAPRRTRCASW
ncbi:hypothetical protein O1L55_19685 [Streptomyces albulus]|nr:hypothetical protein [Streptomyces noursei]